MNRLTLSAFNHLYDCLTLEDQKAFIDRIFKHHNIYEVGIANYICYLQADSIGELVQKIIDNPRLLKKIKKIFPDRISGSFIELSYGDRTYGYDFDLCIICLTDRCSGHDKQDVTLEQWKRVFPYIFFEANPYLIYSRDENHIFTYNRIYIL